MSRNSTTKRAAFLYAEITLRWYAVQRGEVGVPTVVFMEAVIRHGHAHRFRDTFAVGLLQAGVPMDQVSVLLGHSSIKVTKQHYSPWVGARQEQLEADVRRTWEHPTPERTVRPNQ
jgi:integrase